VSEASQSIDAMIAAAREHPDKLGDLLEEYRAFLALWSKQQLGPKMNAAASASDVVQNTFMDAFRAFAQFRGSTEPEFSAWLKRIHANNLIDQFRKRAREGAEPLDLAGDPDDTASFCWREPVADQTSPAQRVVRGEKALRLARAIESLTQAQAEAVRLKHLEGWPVRQIAEHMDRPPSAVAGLLRHGLKKLRESLNRDSWM